MEFKYPIDDLDENSIVLDIGVYLGHWSKWISETYGCKVFGFEPYPKNMKHAKKFLESFPNVKLLDYAVSNIDGSAILYITPKSDGCSLRDRSKAVKPKNITEKIGVNTISLKTFMRKYEIEKIDYIKINAEGSEIEILNSLDEELAAKINQIGFSGHAGKIITEDELNNAIKHAQSLGYQITEYSNNKFKNRFHCKRC